MARISTAPEISEQLERAISAMLAVVPVPTSAKLSVLRRVGEAVLVSPDDIDAAFERVKLRSVGDEYDLCQMEGGGLSDSEFAARLGIASRSSVRAYRGRGRIFAWGKNARNRRYPAWQIHRGALLPGLAEVLSVLAPRKMSSVALADYFLSASDELGGGRPLDLLRRSRVDEVLAHAVRYGTHGA